MFITYRTVAAHDPALYARQNDRLPSWYLNQSMMVRIRISSGTHRLTGNLGIAKTRFCEGATPQLSLSRLVSLERTANRQPESEEGSYRRREWKWRHKIWI
jgi:hypothetical protein